MIELDMSRPYSGPSLIGQTFGRWFVLAYAGKDGRNRPFWTCRCECGEIRAVDGDRLKRGNSESCGCLHRDIMSSRNGMCRSPEFIAWRNMIDRCHDPENNMYHCYGDRGITVCDRWRESFDDFLRDLGLRPGDDYSVGRVENDGNYEPGNVEWQTKEQQANNKSTSRFITYKGETRTLAQWARHLGMMREVLRDRLDRGQSVEDAFETPVRDRFRKLTHLGKTQTVSEWARELGMGTSTIFGRIKSGMTDSECLMTKGYKVGRKKVY